jgi:hypothetical protein
LIRVFVVGAAIGLSALLSCSDGGPTASKQTANPEVLQVWPEDGAEIGGVDGDIRIAFSKPIDLNSITNSSVVIEPYVSMAYVLNEDSVLELHPQEEMDYGAEYTVTITSSVRDKGGSRLREPYEWSFSIRAVVALYVAPDGQGDGTRDNPLGSVQQAVDSVGKDTSIEVIYVATGVYHESLVIPHRTVIYASRDVDDNWRHSRTVRSVLLGESIENQAIGMLVRDVDATVSIRDLTIVARDAGPERSAGSFGVIVQNSSSTSLYHCLIQSGQGRNGVFGVDGEPGVDGGPESAAQGGRGGMGEYETGYYTEDEFGKFWWHTTEVFPPQPGELGFCSDGSQTGGEGGSPTCGDGHDGANGVDGTDGASGRGDNFVAEPVGSAFIARAQDGATGEVGGDGCGGGGGAGCSERYISPFEEPVPGATGGHGGAGATGGSGGTGGTSGGCSVGLFVYQSGVTISRCVIYAEIAGGGADGGAGAVGGKGEVMPDRDAKGGNGGDGGRGGRGGGGAGGSSIALLSMSSTVTQVLDNMLTCGTAGAGAFNDGHTSEGGIAVDMYETDASQ